MDLYVSKCGDDTDGSSWLHACHTISQALALVPPGGGHRVLVRPDTYVEANLYPKHSGARDAYNTLVGDYDGALGSGATGWVQIDSGDGAGFKSYDWWSTMRAYAKDWRPEFTGENFPSIIWDRWNFRRLYVTGSDAGLFFDGLNAGPMCVCVEDCVGIGRAFGGGLAGTWSRPDEKSYFRRCLLWSLDFEGDTAAAYVRMENQTMPADPDVLFEDCVLVSPQCALKSSNYGLTPYTYVAARNCLFFVLNFSQPEMGNPSNGILISVQHGKCLKADLTDCDLAGFKISGVMVEKETADQMQLTFHGRCRAYLQFKQSVPPGVEAVRTWPTEWFARLTPETFALRSS